MKPLDKLSFTKVHSALYSDYKHALEEAYRGDDKWLIDRIFARLENEADISFEEYLELCEIGRPRG